MKLNDTMDYLEIDPNVERAGLARHKVAVDLAQYDQLLYEKRRDACQATLRDFFLTASCPEAPANNEPQPSTSTGGFTRFTPSSEVDDLDLL